MKATATTVLKLIQGSKVFLIPTFQRRYTWRKNQWSQLWNDLVAEAEIDHPEDPETLYGHFLGSVVLHPALGPASTLMRHQVIDGQQRLTTILVLLAAIRDSRKQLLPEWNPREIDDQYLSNPYNKDYPHRLIPTKLDREAYRQTVHENNPTGDIGIAYNYFKSEIGKSFGNDSEKLTKIENTLLLHMLLVEITTKTGDSVNSIFNTLNSKGMDLSAADLVRNEILHHIGEAEAEGAYDRFWIPMETALVSPKSKQTDREFVTFLWSREVAFNPKTSRDDLFPTFERRLRNDLKELTSGDPQSYALAQLEEMYVDHNLFLAIRKPRLASFEIDGAEPLLDNLARLADWRAEPATPIALAILKGVVSQNITVDDGADAIHLLLSYLVKRTLNGIPTNQLNRLFAPIAFELTNRPRGTTATNLLHSSLSKPGYYWPTDDQVLANVGSNPIYVSARRYVKFLLSVAENRMPGTDSPSLTRVQIDHIMPQELSDGWIDDFNDAGVDFADAEAVLHTLGNLTLTENNQRMGNSPFSEKKERYFSNSALRLNRALNECGFFEPNTIRVRSVELAELILEEFYFKPLIGGSSSSKDSNSGSSVEERLFSLLQSLPVGKWVTDAQLTESLGATPRVLHPLINGLDPTLARLVRDSATDIPNWIGDGLRNQIREQDDAQGLLHSNVSNAELLAIVSETENNENEGVDDIDEGIS